MYNLVENLADSKLSSYGVFLNFITESQRYIQMSEKFRVKTSKRLPKNNSISSVQCLLKG